MLRTLGRGLRRSSARRRDWRAVGRPAVAPFARRAERIRCWSKRSMSRISRPTVAEIDASASTTASSVAPRLLFPEAIELLAQPFVHCRLAATDQTGLHGAA